MVVVAVADGDADVVAAVEGFFARAVFDEKGVLFEEADGEFAGGETGGNLAEEVIGLGGDDA